MKEQEVLSQGNGSNYRIITPTAADRFKHTVIPSEEDVEKT